MSEANSLEQYMLELINAERAKTGAQPLAFNGTLNDAAEGHSRWMIDADIFSHTGAGGSDAGTRMRAAGYGFTGTWGWAENIAWVSTRGAPGLADETALLHTNLMNSAGHRANLLNGNYREIGIGLEQGNFQGWDAAMVSQNFARSGTSVFLTGVAYDDLDGDRFYDVGEGLAGATLTATNTATGQVFTAATGQAGGYSLALAAGTYLTSFTAGGFATQTQTVTVGSQNVKLDLADPAAVTGPAPQPQPQGLTLTGTSRADVLTGGVAGDTLSGLGGNDQLNGGAGDDRLLGGAGRDLLTGGEGADRFTFASTADAGKGTARDQILDFADGQDVIDLSGFAGTFSFIGDAAFGRVAGQLRFVQVDGTHDYTLVQGDLNGDGRADFEIEVAGLHRFGAEDFLL